jgi:crotonobetainyl-CoA:carnitine CoA-transferase CaiB-like acyl-CoA transferase
MTLADMGADVIKVERPDLGDESRAWGPPFDAKGRSSYFLSVNRNKKSIALDLTEAEDRGVALGLLRDADIVVDNFLPGALQRFDLNPLEVLARHEQLIWCSITGFGPQSARPGYDFVIQAEQGWMSITGESDGPPVKTGIALADIVTGKDAAIALLAVLAARERGALLTPQQRRIELSLSASALSALINVAQNVLLSLGDAPRHGNGHANLVPYELFDAEDRPIVLAVGNDLQWKACLGAIGGAEELAADSDLATNAGRVRNRATVVAKMAVLLRRKPAAFWMAVFAEAGVPCGIVRSVREALADSVSSPITGVPPSVPGAVRAEPPLLNEHGEAIRRLGWSVFPE